MIKRLSKKSLITDAAEILKALRISLHHGNVVGVFAKQLEGDMYLTAVEDIFSSTVTDQKIIVFKKLDLHGKLLDQNHLALSQIEKMRFFNTLYRDGLHRTLKSIATETDTIQLRIRKRERNILLHELKIIMMKTLDSGHRVRLTLSGKTPAPIEGYIKDLDNEMEKVIIAAGINDKKIKTLPITLIERIEFESFFHFKGLSSKIFHIIT